MERAEKGGLQLPSTAARNRFPGKFAIVTGGASGIDKLYSMDDVIHYFIQDLLQVVWAYESFSCTDSCT